MKFKAYVSVIVGGLVTLASAVLIVLQWGNDATFSLYGRNMIVNTLVLMLCTAVGGVVMWFTLRLLLRGILALNRARKADAKRKAE